MVAWRPIYQDENSIWAAKRGVYVKDARKEGIDLFDEALGIATLILYEYYSPRKITYDHYGNVQRMTIELAKKRLRYIYTLAKRHGATGEALKRIKRLIGFILKNGYIPRRYARRARKAIYNARKLSKNIIKKVFGIA